MAVALPDIHTSLESFTIIDQWSCPTCTADNPFSAYPICTVCQKSNPQPHEDLSITAHRRPRSIWQCPRCTLHNDIVHQMCSACGISQETSMTVELVNLDLSKPSFARSLSVPVEERRHNDEVNAEDIFHHIVMYCHQINKPFVDDQFVPSARSIGSPAFDTVAQWLRISDTTPLSNDDLKLPWTVFSSPQPSDIQQGALGNCWLVAALALVSERPALLEQILLTKTVNSVGVYLVRICHNGLWTTVIVDDCFPCTKHKHLVFTQAKHRQMYVPLIEKACAKIFGSYANLARGHLREGLQLITGAPCDYIDLQASAHPIDSEIVWARLLSACECKLLIGVSSSGTSLTREDYDRVRIHKDHAFSILAVYASKDGSDRFVLVRDPHSHSHYRETSLTKDLLERLRRIHPADRRSGAFWISWITFLRYFSSLTISTYNAKHFDARQRGEFTRSPTQCVTTFHFHLNDTSLINISLIYHRHARKTRTDHVQSFLLCDIDRPHSSRAQMGHRHNILISTRGGFTYWPGSLPAGSFVLLPFSTSFWHGSSDHRDFTVVIHSSLQLDLQIKNRPATFLADGLISSVVTSHNHMKQDKDMIRYSKQSGSKLTLLVVVNTSATEHLICDVNIDAELALLRHSRRQLSTHDCIPPLHRQIIFVTEWVVTSDVKTNLHYRFKHKHTPNRSDPEPEIDQSRHDLHSPRPL